MNSHSSRGMRWTVSLAACGFCLLLGFAATGCKKPTLAEAVDLKAFDSAPQEVKDAWNTALSAAQTNDYVTAYLTLGEMRTQTGLNESQIKALAAEQTLVHARMTEAVEKGDANALKAMQEIRAASRNRGR